MFDAEFAIQYFLTLWYIILGFVIMNLGWWFIKYIFNSFKFK